MRVHWIFYFSIFHRNPFEDIEPEDNLELQKSTITLHHFQSIQFSPFPSFVLTTQNSNMTYKHCSRGNHSPCPPPISMRFISSHLLHTISEFSCPKEPSNANCLKETTPQDWNSTCAVEIHQLFKKVCRIEKIQIILSSKSQFIYRII